MMLTAENDTNVHPPTMIPPAFLNSFIIRRTEILIRHEMIIDVAACRMIHLPAHRKPLSTTQMAFRLGSDIGNGHHANMVWHHCLEKRQWPLFSNGVARDAAILRNWSFKIAARMHHKSMSPNQQQQNQPPVPTVSCALYLSMERSEVAVVVGPRVRRGKLRRGEHFCPWFQEPSLTIILDFW